MDTKDLKVAAMLYVKEDSNLKDEEKISIMEFIKNSSKQQVEFLLLTGKGKEELTKEDEKFIKDSEKSLYEKVNEFKKFIEV